MELLILGSLVLVGLVAGAASGMFGVGGGIVVVPALVLLGDLPFREAVAASLLFITITSPLAVWQHWRGGNVEIRSGLLLGASGLAGIAAAWLLEPFVTDAQLALGFAGLLAWSAHHLAYGKLPELRMRSRLVLVGIGVFSGFVAKLFGIGGGIVVVPALVFTGVDVHVAVGTSLLVVLLNASASTVVNLWGGGGWWIWSLPLAVGALGGTLLGSRQSVRTHGPQLRAGFAVLMLVVAIDLARLAV